MPITQPTIAFQALISSTALNSAFGTFTTEANRVGGIVDAATNAATASTVMKRDSFGGAQVVNFAILPTGSLTGLNLAAGNTYSGVPFGYGKSGGGSMTINNDATVSAPGFIGALTGNVVGNVTGNVTGGLTGNASTATLAAAATALAAPLAFTSAIADFKATPGAAGQISLAAGAAYADSNGAYVPSSGASTVPAQTVSLPAQPSGTNVQYVAITLAPTTGAGTTTAAATIAALSATPIPLANRPVCVVVHRGATTNPSNVIASSDIIEFRNSGVIGGGGGGGGGSGIPTTDAVLTSGDFTGSLPNSKDVTNGATSLPIHPALVRRIVGDSSMDDIQQAWMQPDILSAARLAKSAANAVTLAASNTSPFSARNKKLVASSTAVASGGSNTRYAIFDTAIPGLVTPMPSTNALNPATQSQLAAYWWDNVNSVIQDGLLVDYSSVGQLPSNSITRVTTTASNAWTDTGASGSLGVTSGDSGIVGFPVYTFYAPTQCRMDFITAIGIIYSMASAGSLVISVYLDGVRVGKAWGINTSGTYTVPGPWTGRPIAISPGPHGINLAYNMVGATSTITFLAGFNEIIPTFWKG